MYPETERLKDFIKEQNLTLGAFADKIGVPAASIYNISKGSARITLDVLRAIMVAFPNFDVRYLLTGEPYDYESAYKNQLQEIQQILKRIHI